MTSQTTHPPSKAMPKQVEPVEESYPCVAEPKEGHTGNLLAFISVIAVLGFGVWTAIATLMAPTDKPATKASATAVPTGVTTSVPVAAAPTVAPTAAVATPGAGATPTRAAGSGRVHVVGEGDTLYRIAQRYGTTVEAIMAANGFTDKSKILHIGDRITIP